MPSVSPSAAPSTAHATMRASGNDAAVKRGASTPPSPAPAAPPAIPPTNPSATPNSTPSGTLPRRRSASLPAMNAPLNAPIMPPTARSSRAYVGSASLRSVIVEQTNHASNAPAMPLTEAAYAPFGTNGASAGILAARTRRFMCSSIVRWGEMPSCCGDCMVSRSRPPHTTARSSSAAPEIITPVPRSSSRIWRTCGPSGRSSSSVNCVRCSPRSVVNSTAYAGIDVGQGR